MISSSLFIGEGSAIRYDREKESAIPVISVAFLIIPRLCSSVWHRKVARPMKLALAIFFCLSGLLWGQDNPLTGQRASTQNEELVVHRGSSKLRAVIVQEGESLLDQ